VENGGYNGSKRGTHTHLLINTCLAPHIKNPQPLDRVEKNSTHTSKHWLNFFLKNLSHRCWSGKFWTAPSLLLILIYIYTNMIQIQIEYGYIYVQDTNKLYKQKHLDIKIWKYKYEIHTYTRLICIRPTYPILNAVPSAI